jgi:hypothetical protein
MTDKKKWLRVHTREKFRVQQGLKITGAPSPTRSGYQNIRKSRKYQCSYPHETSGH